MVYSFYYVCILVVLLELVNLLRGIPLHKNDYVDSNITIADDTHNGSSIFLGSLADLRSNKSKEERILNVSSNRGTISFEGYSEQDIIFPDSYDLIFQPVPRIDGDPKCADGYTFCENYDFYPYHHLKDVLRNFKVDKNYFYVEDDPPEVVERIGGVDEDIFICGAVNRVIFPKIAKSKNNKWKYIVNQGKDDSFAQGIRTETCRHLGQPCDLIGELPQGYRTACKQKYVFRRLLSLNENGVPIPDTFQIPSACCCSYRRDLGFLTRIGKQISPAK